MTDLLAYSIALVICTGVAAAYWRRCRGGGWWPEKQGPWWASRALLELWATIMMAVVLWAVGAPWWAAPGLGLAWALMWNPSHSMGLSFGRQELNYGRDPEWFLAKWIADLFAGHGQPPGPAQVRWCVIYLSVNYGIRTLALAALGAWAVGPGCWALAPAGLAVGPLYALGWAIYERGWRPVFTQPPHFNDGHLFGEWLAGGCLGASQVASVVLAVHLLHG